MRSPLWRSPVYPIIAKLAAIDEEEERREERERQLTVDREDWVRAYQSTVRPRSDPSLV
jgi:hypothetical protein